MDLSIINSNDLKNIKELLVLSSEIFGEGFTNEKKIKLELELGFGISIRNGGILIGFLICFLPGKYKKSDIGEIHEDLVPKINEYAYIKSIILKKMFQGKGYGKKLLNFTINILKEKGISNIFLHAWDGSPNNSSINFFKKNGANYNKWYNDSLKNGWNCSKCGKPCYCNSVEIVINF